MNSIRPELRAAYFVVLTIVYAGLPCDAVQAERSRAIEAAESSTPRSSAEFRQLEERVRQVLDDVAPAIVRVQAPRPEGMAPRPKGREFRASGVIIRKDGLVLSQWHVTHENQWRDAGSIGKVALPDGRLLKARLLGADPVRDLSLMQIVEPGAYPFVPLDTEDQLAMGDWVLKLGHPGGIRPVVSRLGRVLYLGETLDIVADCLTSGGDSGGPLIDLNGRVVGIIKGSAWPRQMRVAIPVRRGVCPDSYSSARTIRNLMPKMLEPVEDTTRVVRRQTSPGFALRQKRLIAEMLGDTDPETLPTNLWTQGAETRAALTQLGAGSAASVVEILRDETRVALGAVVDAEGWVVTKASEIPDAPRCRLADGAVVPAVKTAVDPAFDLALLKIEATDLQPVSWATGSSQPVGTMVTVPSLSGGLIGIGIICVGQRKLEGPYPTSVTPAPPRGAIAAALPEIAGTARKGDGFRVTYVGGRAAAADICVGDVILSTDGRPPTQNEATLIDDIRGRSFGDRITLLIARGGEKIERRLVLKGKLYSKYDGARYDFMSHRRDGFPLVFNHDIPLTLDECGGPIVDLNGNTIGITIARVGHTGCMAIPADILQTQIAKLMASQGD